MKILDRYIIRVFLTNYVISFLVLVGLYVVLDMVFNFDELLNMEKQTTQSSLETMIGFIRDAGDYYFYQIFLYFVQLSGIIPVVAAAFTMIRLSHFNELSALLSAGVPLLRVAAPMILCALLLNGLLLVDQELVIPQIIPKLARKHDEVREVARNSFPIRAMQDSDKALLLARRFFPADNPPTMEGLAIIQGSGQDRALITAAGAAWNAEHKRWDLTKGDIIRDLTHNVMTSDLPREPIQQWRSSITPEEIQLYRNGEFVELLSTQRINELLNHTLTYGRLDLARIKHARFTQVFVNIILLLLAIGSIMTREPQRLKSASTKCLILCGACLASVFIMHQIAAQPPNNNLAETWPALMAWMPIFIFGPTSIWLLDRIKT